jgi:two-component system NtrC family sensor kinase
MKKACWTVVFCILYAGTVIAQDGNRVSTNDLESQLQRAKQDTARIRIMTELADHYRYSNSDTSIYYANSALEQATKAKFKKGQASALIELGLTLREQGDLPKALDNLLKGAEIAKAEELKRLILLSNLGLGRVYYDLGDFDQAIRHMKATLQLSGELGDDYQRKYSLINVVFCYNLKPDLYRDSSFKYIGLTRNALNTQDDKFLWASFYRATSNYYYDVNKDFDSSIFYARKALPLYFQLNDNRNAASGLALMANNFLKLNQLDSCIYYAQRSLDISQANKLRSRVIQSSGILASVNKAKGNYEKAFYYQEMMIKEKENLLGKDNMKAIRTMIEEKQQHEYENEQARNEFQSRFRMNIFLGSTFTLLVIAFFLYRNNRLKQKANQKIESAYNQLKATQSQLIQSEKMASLGELTAGIAHEIQNPLNFVNNFSEVNKELLTELKDEIKKGNTDEASAIADDVIGNEEKINHHGKRADAIVKGMLQHSRSSNGQKEPTDINALCDEYLRLSYHGLRAKDKSFNAKFETVFDNNIEKINVVPQDIGRVVLNLINNAFYAVNEKAKQNISGYEPTVMVSTKNENGKVIISVKDNGNGIPDHIKEKIFQPFFTTKPTGSGTGLGLSLSYDIVKAHGGELSVESIVNEQTKFTINLPLT